MATKLPEDWLVRSSPGRAARRLRSLQDQLEEARSRGASDSVPGLVEKVARQRNALVAAHRCRCCGRALADPLSISRGIGSTCWARGER